LKIKRGVEKTKQKEYVMMSFPSVDVNDTIRNMVLAGKSLWDIVKCLLGSGVLPVEVVKGLKDCKRGVGIYTMIHLMRMYNHKEYVVVDALLKNDYSLLEIVLNLKLQDMRIFKIVEAMQLAGCSPKEMVDALVQNHYKSREVVNTLESIGLYNSEIDHAFKASGHIRKEVVELL